MSDERPLFVSVTVAATLLGMSERAAYASIHRGDFPVPVVKVGTRMKVSRRLIERLADGEVAS